MLHNEVQHIPEYVRSVQYYCHPEMVGALHILPRPVNLSTSKLVYSFAFDSGLQKERYICHYQHYMKTRELATHCILE